MYEYKIKAASSAYLNFEFRNLKHLM